MYRRLRLEGFDILAALPSHAHGQRVFLIVLGVLNRVILLLLMLYITRSVSIHRDCPALPHG